METAAKIHLENIHTDCDSFITVATKTNGFISSHYHYRGVEEAHKRVIEANQNQCDIYVSNASYSRPQRGKATLFRINTLFVDIDCHNGEFNLDSLMFFLKEEFFERSIATPSEIVSTGRGIQLYWYLENAPKQVLPLWELLQMRILEELDEISEFLSNVSVDKSCKDITRIARVPGTMNTKNNKMAYVVEANNIRYRLDEIIEGYYPDLHISEERREEIKIKNKDWSTKSKKVKVDKTIIRLFNAYTLSYQRSVDLLKLLELRGGDMKGYRDEFIFIYIWTVIDKKSTLDDVNQELSALNSLFKVPMVENKIRAKAKHVYNKFQSQVLKKSKPSQKYHYYDRYIFRNQTIINRLNISEEEQKEMTTIIATREKYDRNNERRCPKDKDGYSLAKAQIKERRAEVKTLMNLGYGYKKIASTLNIKQSIALSDVRALKK